MVVITLPDAMVFDVFHVLVGVAVVYISVKLGQIHGELKRRRDVPR